MLSNSRPVNHPSASWLERRRLRAFSRIGAGARLEGRADIGGGGEISVGDRFLLLSHPVRSHIFASSGAVITIGDDVHIAYGAAIAAQKGIVIGDNTVVGPYIVIMDNDFHRVGKRNEAGESSPVQIGCNVHIGARVTILRGSTIGDNVRILSGSMVSGAVPDGVTIGGVPARVIVAGVGGERNSMDMAELVQSVLGLAERPSPDQGPAQIAAWDSLGNLRLLLAIEETYGVHIGEAEMRSGNTVAALSTIIKMKLAADA